MANGKFSNGKRSNLKPVALLLAIALLVGTAVGGTLAWLTDKTDSVKNTFTVGNIDIELNETKDDFKMIPGYTIEKDPKVTVKAGSEKSWVFVDIDEGNNLDKYITYVVGSGWTQLEKNDKDKDIKDQLIFYREQPALTGDDAVDAVYSVIGYMNGDTFAPDKVQVKETVTKADMDALLKKDAEGNVDMENGKPVYDADKLPTLTFTAYAVQYNESNNDPFTPAEAWAKVAS